MTELAGQHALVLRPSPEGAELANALRRLGADALHFPTITIEALPAPPLPETAPDLLVFISPNAVRHGGTALAAAPQATVAAIGQGTAAALQAAGRAPTVVPEAGYTSEALLAHPALERVHGRTAWIVRGRGGRALLGETLRARGARVQFVEVYARRPARPAPTLSAHARRLLGADPPAWVVATSPETWRNLFELLGESTGVVRLVTSSDRVIQLAQRRTAAPETLRTRGPDNRAVIDALLQWARNRAAARDGS